MKWKWNFAKSTFTTPGNAEVLVWPRPSWKIPFHKCLFVWLFLVCAFAFVLVFMVSLVLKYWPEWKWIPAHKCWDQKWESGLNLWGNTCDGGPCSPINWAQLSKWTTYWLVQYGQFWILTDWIRCLTVLSFVGTNAWSTRPVDLHDLSFN